MHQPDAGDSAAPLELDRGQRVVVNVQDLWRLTTWFAIMETVQANTKGAILDLEKATGRGCCPRRQDAAT